VVGCGSIGKRHARNVAKISETAVIDIYPEIAKGCAHDLGVRYFPNLDEGLGWQPDGVIVAVPNDFHIPVAKAAIESGADVLIEKPISKTIDGVDSFLNRADELKRRVYVACNMRFHPAVTALRDHLPKVGRPLFARAHVGNYLPNMRPGSDYRNLYCASRKQGGGVILDAIHEIDYLTWFFGTAQNVRCEAAKLSDLDIDVEDFACIWIEHETHTVSEIQMDYLRPFKRRGCEIVGDHGMLLWSSEGKEPEYCSVRKFDQESGRWVTLIDEPNLDINKPYAEMIHQFVRALAGNDTPLLRGRLAAAELATALKALTQAEETFSGWKTTE